MKLSGCVTDCDVYRSSDTRCLIPLIDPAHAGTFPFSSFSVTCEQRLLAKGFFHKNRLVVAVVAVMFVVAVCTSTQLLSFDCLAWIHVCVCDRRLSTCHMTLQLRRTSSAKLQGFRKRSAHCFGSAFNGFHCCSCVGRYAKSQGEMGREGLAAKMVEELKAVRAFCTVGWSELFAAFCHIFYLG